MAKSWYFVTDIQGMRPDIAGQRRKVGARISLTDNEARFEVSRGTVVTEAEWNEREESKAKAAKVPAVKAAKPK